MDYKTAQLFKNKSLSSLITNKIVSGENIGTSIKKSISEKLQAKATRTKEKFDPLNIAKFLTGGGNLAPAILGKLTGRSQKDIKYFSGGGQDTAKKLVKMNTETIGSLSEIFAFIKKNHEKDLEMQETERSFREEKQNEEQRRHDEFLKVLKSFISGKESSPTAEQAEEENIFSKIFGWVKKMISDAIKYVIETIQNMFSWINGLRILEKIAPWLSGLATAATKAAKGLTIAAAETLFAYFLPTAAVGALLFLLADTMDNIRKNPNDPKYRFNPFAMMVRGESPTVEAAGQKNIGRARKGTTKPTIIEALNPELNLSDKDLETTFGANRAILRMWLEKNKNNEKAIFKPEIDIPQILSENPELDRPLQTDDTTAPAPAPVRESLSAAGARLKETTYPNVVRFVESEASDEQLIEQIGADRPTLQKWLEQNKNNPKAVFKPSVGPNRSLGSASETNQTASPVPDAAGATGAPGVSGDAGSMASQQSSFATPVDTEMAKETFRRSEIEKQNMTTVPTGNMATISSVSSTPRSADVFNMSNENYNLALNDLHQGPSAPIVKNSVNNSSTQENFSVPASLRDPTVIMSRVIKQSSAYV